jgi:CheY-like chemotaxis protein
MPTVLVVEDHNHMRAMLGELLTLEGYEPLLAGCGEEAIQLAPIHLPDVVLLDLKLPGIDGCETARLLKSDPATQHIPIIGTSLVYRSLASQVSHLFDGFFPKPFELDDLITTIEYWTRGSDGDEGGDGEMIGAPSRILSFEFLRLEFPAIPFPLLRVS